jgi:hypothetical protein
VELVKKVVNKMNEYGLKIFEKHTSDDGEVIIYSTDMILFIDDMKKKINVSFQATTKPETSATLALIIGQVENSLITVMEAFIFDQNNNFISGEEAYKLIDSVNENKILRKFKEEQVYEC